MKKKYKFIIYIIIIYIILYYMQVVILKYFMIILIFLWYYFAGSRLGTLCRPNKQKNKNIYHKKMLNRNRIQLYNNK